MTYPPAAPPQQRRVWPWIIAGIGALFLLGVGIAIGVVLVTAAQKEADLESAEQTVVDFDAAFEDLDCDQFEAVTDEDLRDELYAPDGYDCDVWAENAEKFFDDDGDYTFDVEVQSVRVSGDRARVDTVEEWEVDGEKYSGTVTYRLERIPGGWIITEYDDELDESDNAEEPTEPEEEEEPDLTADEVVAEDLKNAKAALLAYYLVEGSWDGVTDEQLAVYGYGPSLGTTDMAYYIDASQEEATYCIEATASETGNTFWIRPDTVAKPGLCSDPVE